MMKSVCFYVILRVAYGFLIPELKINKYRFCPESFENNGWILLNTKSTISYEPSSLNLGMGFSDHVLIRFCESEISLPQGHYCVFESRRCSSGFKTIYDWVPPSISGKILSEGLSRINMCCQSNTDHIDAPFKTDMKPPFSLISRNGQCQRFHRTKATLIKLKVDEEVLLSLCFYEPDLSCSTCQQNCDRKDYGSICSCYQGYSLMNNSHCRYSRSCDKDNGLCDHYCIPNHTGPVSCQCKADYQLVESRMCLPRDVSFEPITTQGYDSNAYQHSDNVTNQEQRRNKSLFNPPLFTLSRDFVVMLVVLVVAIVVFSLVFCLLIRLKCVLCTPPHMSCPLKLVCCRTIVRRPKKYHQKRVGSVCRDSITVPHMGVAVDLLNRPKSHHGTLLRNVTNPIGETVYYTNTGHSVQTSSNGSYNALDNRDRFSKQTSEIHYDEPDQRPRNLTLPNVDPQDQYYCAPDVDEGEVVEEPETPLPAYPPTPRTSTVLPPPPAFRPLPTADTAPHTTKTPPPPPPPKRESPIYRPPSEKYEDPATKFHIGKLGKRSKLNNGNNNNSNLSPKPGVARIVPVPRYTEPSGLDVNEILDQLKRATESWNVDSSGS